MAKAKKHQKIWLINALLLVALIAAWWLQQPTSEVAESISLKRVPYLVGNMVGNNVALTPFEASLYERGEWIKRNYRRADRGGEQDFASVLAVQTKGDRHIHHPPEYCYTGSGWQVVDSAEADWKFGRASGAPTIALLERESPSSDSLERDLVAYWFADGERIVGSYFERVMWDTLDRLSGSPQAWVMIRVALPLDGGRRQGDDLEVEIAKRQIERIATLIQSSL